MIRSLTLTEIYLSLFLNCLIVTGLGSTMFYPADVCRIPKHWGLDN
jgi:hypothetical protein